MAPTPLDRDELEKDVLIGDSAFKEFFLQQLAPIKVMLTDTNNIIVTVKVEFDSSEGVGLIMKNKHNIAKKSIKISSDRTPFQQAVLMRVFEELNGRRLNVEPNLRLQFTKGKLIIVTSN